MKKTAALVIIFSILALPITSCNWTKDKSKKAIHKTGEIIGKTGSEFGDVVYKGVKKTFENEVKISAQLKAQGLDLGEVLINSTDSTIDNILTAYIIFNDNFDQEVTIKIFNENGKEYGRSKKYLTGEKDDAKHFDLIFNKHVNIEPKSSIIIE